MSKQEVILCRNFGNDLINAIKKCPHDRLFVLTDENTHKHCLLNEKNIFEGKDDRFILIIGPCSADKDDSVIDYISRLRNVQEKVSDKILIIPRIFNVLASKFTFSIEKTFFLVLIEIA